jgi:hypothetical protein
MNEEEILKEAGKITREILDLLHSSELNYHGGLSAITTVLIYLCVELDLSEDTLAIILNRIYAQYTDNKEIYKKINEKANE